MTQAERLLAIAAALAVMAGAGFAMERAVMRVRSFAAKLGVGGAFVAVLVASVVVLAAALFAP